MRSAQTIRAWQNHARDRGWRGVWNPGVKGPCGKDTSGVAVLTRNCRPIFKIGDSDDRMITAMVPWTRRVVLMVTSVYGWDTSKTGHENLNVALHNRISGRVFGFAGMEGSHGS